MERGQTTHLHCTKGTSDKLYLVTLEDTGAGWIVKAQYGRRGRALKEVLKTEAHRSVSYVEANRIYLDLIRSKKAGHYVVIDRTESTPNEVAQPKRSAIVIPPGDW